MDYNYCNLEGRLVKDAVLSTTASGKDVLRFSLAIGTMKDVTDYFDFTLWGQRAGKVASFLTKGRHIIVLCQARYQKWQDKNTGESRSRVVFDVQNITFKDGNNSASRSDNPADEYVTKAAAEAKQQQKPLPTTHFTEEVPFGDEKLPAPENFDDDIPF